MGILFNTVSFCQFRVVGDQPKGDLYQWVSGRLARNGFRSIDNTIDQASSGWVHLDDSSGNSFNSPRAF